MLVACVILLFTQAMLDLTLPDLLSRIVNTGIQASGIEDAAMSAMRQQTMERITLFMSEEDESLVREAYELVDSQSVDYLDLVDIYPHLLDEPIYFSRNLDEDTKERIAIPIGRSLMAISAIEQAMAHPEDAPLIDGGAFDFARIPPGADIFQLLGGLPAAQRQQLTQQINHRFEALGDKLISQTAVLRVKAEYEALGVDIAGLQSNYIWRTGVIMLLVTLASAACTISVAYLSAKVAAGTGRDLRSAVFTKVENFSGVEFDRFPTASLITRNTNDITQMQMVTMFIIRLVFYAPIMGIGGIIRAIGKGSSMWWTIAVAVIVLLGVIATLVTIALPRFRIIQSLIDRLNLVARENLSGIMVIRAFNMQDFEKERFDQANVDLTATTLFIARAMATMMPIMMLILNVMSITILWVGAQQVSQANMQVGDVMAFLQYAMLIVFSFLMMSILFVILPRAQVSANRVADVLETDLVIRDPAIPRELNGSFRGNVEFKNVSFRYPGADTDVLHDINFTAKPGETTAFIGSTGSGKSTVVNLIPRFYDVTEGEILLDGIDIRDVTQHDLREKIGYVPQRGVLFSGSIESNLRFGDEDASEEALQEAVSIAQVSDFVNGSPEGLSAEISQGGTNVSGGQRQRLSIARALVKKAPIYIFDDTFSALDFRTDAALRRALKETIRDSAVLVVTQRVATVKNAEQIIVLEEGRVVGRGSHRELMETCETYQEIALSQLSREELLS
jgi:ATP-binding cassette subfamily B protein